MLCHPTRLWFPCVVKIPGPRGFTSQVLIFCLGTTVPSLRNGEMEA